MKLRLILPPLVALLAVCIWLGWQRQTISILQEETKFLEQAIAQAPTLHAEAELPVPKHDKFGLDGPVDEIDWKALSVLLFSNTTGMPGDVGAFMKFQSRLTQFSLADFEAAFTEIERLDLSPKQQLDLENLLLEGYAIKDPQAALVRFSDRFRDEDSGAGWQLSRAFGAWLKTNPESAIAWYDQSVAEGNFDSKSLENWNTMKLQFDAQLFKHLVREDISAAQEWVLDLPEDQRVAQLGVISAEPENFAVIAKLARGSFEDANDSLQAIAILGSQNVRPGNFRQVDVFIENAGLTKDEINAVVKESSARFIVSERTVTRDKIRQVGTWAAEKSPASEAEAVGIALNSAGRSDRNSYASLAEIAKNYHPDGNNDTIIAAFIRNSPVGQNREEAMELLQSVSDPVLRSELEQHIR